MVYNKDILNGICQINDQNTRRVFLPEGNTLEVACVGRRRLDNDHTINNVLCIPDFTHNLLSVSKLIKDLKCVVTFFPDICVMQDLHSRVVKEIGREVDGLYNIQLPIKKEENKSQLTSASMVYSDNNKVGSFADMKIWHRRLGHALARVLKQVSSLKFKNNWDEVQPCNVGPLARQTRMPFPSSYNRCNKPFHTIHGDVWGPYRVPSHNGCRFFLTLVDDCSRKTWVYMLRMKCDVIVVLRQFLALIKTQFNEHVKFFRSDNGTGLFNSRCTDLFSSSGIIHQSSCVHTPQQNGLVERKHRHILEVARAIRLSGFLPLKFWNECVLNVVYVMNRLPMQVLSGKSPFEVLYA